MAYTAVYGASDLGSMLIDVIGAIFNALAMNAGTIAILVVITLIIILAVDALTGMFGIVKFLRGSK